MQKTKYLTLFVLGAYLLWLGYLLQTGLISQYINPKLAYLTLISLLLLGIMFIYTLTQVSVRTKQHSSCCDAQHDADDTHHHCNCDHTSKLKIKNVLILLLPLVLSWLVTPTSIGLSNNQAARVKTATASKIKGEARETTQLEIGEYLFEKPGAKRAAFLNSKFYLVGKVLRTSKLNSDELVLYRMLISCCVADAVPLGVVVKLPAKNDLQNEEWVGVTGKLEFRAFPKELSEVEPITNMVPPEKIYVYFTATDYEKLAAPVYEYLFP